MHLRLFLRHPIERRPCGGVATYLSRRTHASAMPLERKKVGEVFHFYTKIGVAAIRVTEDGIAIGDTVQIQGLRPTWSRPWRRCRSNTPWSRARVRDKRSE